ncbi:MAG: TM1812 family CRISPR-associated protein [Ruminococcus sp.]
MKKFISVSPHQPPEKFSKGIYKAVDNDKLNYEAETGFPVITALNGYTADNDEIEVITVVSDFENAKRNYETFVKETNELAAKKNVKINHIQISIPYNESIDTQLEMFSKLIDCTADEDELYCDITYGTKVMSQILTMSLNYGYRIHKDVVLGCIVYGAKNHNTNELAVYDITALNYMDEIVRMFAENKVSNPSAAIKDLLK